MKIWLLLAAALLLAACSDAPKTEAKTQEPPAEPLTGRQAFQYTYPSARIWASDCQPIRIRSFNLEKPKSKDGKAGAWEVMYVSESRARSRTYTWSAVELSESMPKGVFAGHEEPWSGPRGQERPFLTAAIRTDTPEALEIAVSKSREYLDKSGEKPQINFLLESTPRYSDPAWRVYWGNSVSSAEWSVFVDATLGTYLGR
jgi:hypothetical protein